MPQLTNKHQDAVRRWVGTYANPLAPYDHSGMEDPYRRPERRIRPNLVKWWYHGWIPIYGRVMRRLSPCEVYMHTGFFYDFTHRAQKNLYKYGPVILVGGTFYYGFTKASEYMSINGHRSLRLQ